MERRVRYSYLYLVKFCIFWAFHRHWSAFARKAHCIEDSILLDDTCGTGDFLINTNNDRIVKVERGNTKYMEMNA